jgi:hypothetical protein
MAHRRRAKVFKNIIKNTFKAPQEVDLTIKSALPILIPFTFIKQSKGAQTFILNMAVYADNTMLFSNVLPISFGAFNFQEFVAKNAC